MKSVVKLTDFIVIALFLLPRQGFPHGPLTCLPHSGQASRPGYIKIKPKKSVKK